MSFKNNNLKTVLFLLLLISSFILTSCKLWTVVEHNKEASSEAKTNVHLDGETTDLVSYVDTIWNGKIISYINNHLSDINVILNELENGVDIAGRKYGIREAEGKPWKFIAKGSGRVLSVNNKSRAGSIGIDLKPYDQSKDLQIQIGPVIRGTSIRDSLDFISFNNFGNQIEFAKFSSTINDKINTDLLQDIDFEILKGSEISFHGVFVLQSSEIIMTPVQIEIIGGRK